MVRSIAISRNGDYTGAVLLSPDSPSYYADGEILFLDRDGNILWKYAGDYTVERIAVSDDGNFVYASGTPRLYSFARNGTITAMNESQGRTWVLVTAGDGSYAIAGGTITERVHIAGSRTFVNRIDTFETDGMIPWNYSTRNAIRSIGISADGDTIITAAGYELSSFARNGTMRWQLNSGPDITSIAVSSDGEYIAVGSQYYARLFNRSGSMVWRYDYDGFVHDIGISDDGKLIVAGMSDGVYVFDQQGSIIWKYPAPTAVRHISVSNDGEFFAAGSTDTVYFFNRYGNDTIPEYVKDTPLTTSTVHENTRSQPEPATTAPLPFTLAFGASGITAIAAKLFRKR